MAKMLTFVKSEKNLLDKEAIIIDTNCWWFFLKMLHPPKKLQNQETMTLIHNLKTVICTMMNCFLLTYFKSSSS